MRNKVSYALGLSIANNFLAAGIKSLEISDFTRAVEDVLQGKEPAFSYEEAQQEINAFFAQIKEESKDLNARAGEEFLKINGAKQGVVTLPSGLQYEVFKMGEGAKPKLSDTVRCHYHGTLINGTVFDSSKERGTPAEFPLQGVIPGWTEILQLMPVGSEFKVSIPAHLAYGEQGAGQTIGPNSTLIFRIELLDIVNK